MTDIDKVDAILRHIRTVQDNCRVLGERLIDKGECDLGVRLISNSLAHDQSKLSGMEWDHLYPTNSDKDSLAMAVNQHNKTNPHHPEYWGSVHKMPRVYIAEMVADWKTRASEFGTSLKDWINGDAAKRYSYNQRDPVYKEIMYFFSILCDQPFTPVRAERQNG
jgi:hypothetical protein